MRGPVLPRSCIPDTAQDSPCAMTEHISDFRETFPIVSGITESATAKAFLMPVSIFLKFAACSSALHRTHSPQVGFTRVGLPAPLHTLRLFFRTSPLDPQLAPKSPKKGGLGTSRNYANLKASRRVHRQDLPKNFARKGGQVFATYNNYDTLSYCPKVQGSQNRASMRAKLKPPCTNNHNESKTSTATNSKNTTLPNRGVCVSIICESNN